MKRIISMTALALTLLLTLSSAFAHQWCWSCNKDNTYGWQLMTPEERKDHQAKLAGFASYDLCKEYTDQHKLKMDERAKAKDVDLPVMQTNPCDEMKSRGVFK